MGNINMKSKTCVCLMLLSLFLCESIYSFKINKYLENKIQKPHKLTLKEVDDRYKKLILNDKLKKEKIEKNLKLLKGKIEKINAEMNPNTNCVKFFDKINYQGKPILILCDKTEKVARLAVEAQNPKMKNIKSFK